MEGKEYAELLKRAEELLGRPLAPKEDPAFLRDLKELSDKDPALAKALVTGARATEGPAQAKEAGKVARRAEAALRSANRAAQMRERIRRIRDRVFSIPMTLMGRPFKAPNKRVLLLVILLLVGAVMGAAFMLTSTPQREKRAVGLTPGAAETTTGEASGATDEREALQLRAAKLDELKSQAELVMGRPAPAYGTPEYEAYMQELKEKNPALAENLDQALVARAALEEAKQMASEDVTGISTALREVVPGGAALGAAQAQGNAVQAQGGAGAGDGGQATPPPPVPVPPPPPPPNVAGAGSPEMSYGLLTLAGQPSPRPLSAGEGGGQAQGQGSTGPGSRFLMVEGKGLQGLTQGQDSKREALVGEGRTLGGGMPGGPGPSSSGGYTLWQREAPTPLSVSGQERTGKGVLTVLAEAPKEGAPRTSSPSSTATPSQETAGVPGMGFPPVSSPSAAGGPVTASLVPPGFQVSPVPSSPTPQPQAAQTPVNLPYIPGRTYTARLNFQLVVAEGGTSPVVLEGADGGLFVGTAKLDPSLGRVTVDLETLYLHGREYAIRAMVYDGGQLGLSAQIREEAPTLAQDILRAAANSFSRYVDLLSKQTQVTTLPGGGVAASQQAPPLEYVLLGEVGRLFSVPEGRKSLVRIAQVDQGKVVQVLFLGGR